jgi:hypothetical protein
MSVAERDYSRGGPEKAECMMPRCTRPRREEDSVGLCELHHAIWDADADGAEAHCAAVELLPPMIALAESFGNDFLERGLKELQVKAFDYSERRYLDYEMLHHEDEVNLD